MRKDQVTSEEYAPFYAPYFNTLDNVELLEELDAGKTRFSGLIKGLSAAQLGGAYAPGKWTLAEVIQHIIDSERVFQYRALRIARQDSTALAGFDQDLYVSTSHSETRNGEALAEEFEAVRDAGIWLFKSFTAEDLLRIGKASGAAVSVRALGFMICGHQFHHEKVMHSRYLNP